MIIRTKKKTCKWNIGKCLCNIFAFLGAVMLIWFAISYLEICIKNLDNPPVYCKYNLWGLMLKIGGAL